jgi:hypothetical protein
MKITATSVVIGTDMWDYEDCGRPATDAEADQEYALNVGHDNPDVAWILSDRDVWYRNPFYRGPEVRHPEDYDEYY